MFLDLASPRTVFKVFFLWNYGRVSVTFHLLLESMSVSCALQSVSSDVTLITLHHDDSMKQSTCLQDSDTSHEEMCENLVFKADWRLQQKVQVKWISVRWINVTKTKLLLSLRLRRFCCARSLTQCSQFQDIDQRAITVFDTGETWRKWKSPHFLKHWITRFHHISIAL